MRVTLNGKIVDTECKSVFELGRGVGGGVNPDGGETVVILNGYQLSKDAGLKDGDTVSFIKKGVMPGRDELESMMAARHTPGAHEKLKAARVAVAGLGGLGSHIAVSLARLGVGELLLVDYDVVEPSNLNRQSYFISHLGMKKTDALKNQLADINGFIYVNTVDAFITEDNAANLFKGYNIVCEAFDNPESKAVLVSTLLSKLPGVKVVAASGLAGFGSSNDIRTRVNFGRLYVCGDETSAAEIGCGLMSPRVQICAGHQANMVLRLILGIDDA
ncbi:MAG: sulfur carrier protein ThiS adenylyltransferase ThiF [Chitinispirillales bacterium]|jgi:sulfur carrier protein ThiS adenylyltransferase|nr:sulfur carrier protein ThiS adenylyltransferase ThiF [Chitinispirillales bacterium]